MYLELAGIPGDVDVAGREGTIEVGDIDWRVYIPTDADNGALTGTRKHNGLTFVKNPDRSSPILFGKVCTGETVSKATFTFFEITDQGEERASFKLILEGVKVAAFQSYNPGILTASHSESVTLRYAKITMVYLDGNLQHSDAWPSR